MKDDLRAKHTAARERLAEVLEAAYREPPPGWVLRDLACPLLLELSDLVRLALEELEGCERACADRGAALERLGKM